MTKNTLEKRIETLIQQEIFTNQSFLVEELILKPNPDWIEHIENYYDENSETIEAYLTCETDIKEATLQELDVHERLDLAREEGFEKVFERWLVSDWLADGLKEFEQPVLEMDYGSWWPITCNGQAIKMDYVICLIVRT
ncbi:MAG: hypothetical protein R2828_29595 [Saprospiraceae bacterium]